MAAGASLQAGLVVWGTLATYCPSWWGGVCALPLELEGLCLMLFVYFSRLLEQDINPFFSSSVKCIGMESPWIHGLRDSLIY